MPFAGYHGMMRMRGARFPTVPLILTLLACPSGDYPAAPPSPPSPLPPPSPPPAATGTWPNEPAWLTVRADWGLDRPLPTVGDVTIPGSPGWSVIGNAPPSAV